MIKQTISYEDFDGNQQQEDHYFHLSKKELIDMEIAEPGGLAAKLERIGKEANGREIMAMFQQIVAAAYGQRVDGSSTKFYKSQKVSDEFMGSLAYDAFFTKLLTDSNFAVEFINGVIPKDLQEQMNTVQDVPLPAGEELPWAHREPTPRELTTMTREQLTDVYRRREHNRALGGS